MQSIREEHDPLRQDVATLKVRRSGRFDPDRLFALLADATWLGELVVGGAAPAAPDDLEPGTRRYVTDLVMPLPPEGRLLSFRKAALVDIGPALVGPNGGRLPIAWRSASLAPLFPVFAGHLRVARDELTIEGHYAPPGGAIGMAADRVLLHIAARGTGRWFLDRLAGAAGAEGPKAV
jgi:hypothetical protein